MKKQRYLAISMLTIFTMIVTACGDKNTKKDPIILPATEGEQAFSEVTVYDEPVDVHTPEQRAFLDYIDEGKYEELTSSQIQTITGQNSRGSLNLSAPKPVVIEFTQEHKEENFDKYVVELSMDGQWEDDLVTVEATTDNNGNPYAQIYNLYNNQDYYYRVKALYTDDSFDVSETYTLKMANSGIRNLYVDGMTNCRDLGGKATVDGGYIKPGLLYRTAALDDSQSGSIATAAGKKTLKEVLKVKTEIELRGNTNGQGGEAKNDNNSALDDTINYQFKPFAYQSGKNLLFRNIEPVRKTFEVLGNADNYPVFFHCRIGTDRTGLIALLVNALCGLSLQEIYQDYLFSDFGCIGKVPTVGQANEDSIAEYVNELKEFPGEKLQNSVYNFLLTAGIPAETLDNVINILTEEGSVEGNDSSRVHVEDVASDHIELDGLQVTNIDSIEKYTDKNRAPQNTVNFTAVGNKVTYTFNSDKAFDSDLYAYLTSRNTSGKLNTAFKVTLNGDELEIKDTSFATNTLGFGSAADYWIPSLLKDGVSFVKGENVLEIEALTTTSIKMGHIAFSGMSESAKIS